MHFLMMFCVKEALRYLKWEDHLRVAIKVPHPESRHQDHQSDPNY